MRHRKSGRKFNRAPSHRKALLKNLAIALVTNGRITTTVAKAKSLRGVVEPLVTLALRNDVHSRRQVFAVLGDRNLVSKLFDEIAPLYTNTGGYTRVIKLAAPRKGDSAPMAIIEFVKHGEGKEAATDEAAADKKTAPKKASGKKAATKDAGEGATSKDAGKTSAKKAPAEKVEAKED